MKLIEELREKTEGFEKENYYLKKNFEDKEKIYSEKIKFLENQLQIFVLHPKSSAHCLFVNGNNI